MSDIVEWLRTIRSPRAGDAADTIEALRQRVKLLEQQKQFAFDEANLHHGRMVEAQAELATLKQAQEPVAWMIDCGINPLFTTEPRGADLWTPIYTSAPTIPNEVDEELASAESLIAKISGSAMLAGEKCHKDDKALLYKIACDALVTIGYARSLLSAAPKPGKPA